MVNDWSKLPLDLLGLLVERLAIADYIRFGCACTSWRSAASPDLHPPTPHQAPWLMLSGDTPATTEFSDTTTNRSYKIQIPPPDIRSRVCIGSHGGWLVTADDRPELHLLNPVTGAQLDLPSITTFPFIETVRDSAGKVLRYLIRHFNNKTPMEMAPSNLLYFFYRKAVPFVLSGRHVILLIHNPAQRLSFARAGDHSWTPFPTSSDYKIIYDVTVHDGRVYTLNQDGVVRAWNIDAGIPVPLETLVFPKPTEALNSFDMYLLWLPGGDLLQVWREADHANSETDPYWTIVIRVQRFQADENKWVEVETLGDYALFIGGNQSMCLSSRNVPDIKRNCVYFTAENVELWYSRRHCSRDVGIYNLEDRSFKFFFPTDDDDKRSWPPPIWITPSLV